MDLHLFVNRERKNLYLARQISARQRSTARSWLSLPTPIISNVTDFFKIVIFTYFASQCYDVRFTYT